MGYPSVDHLPGAATSILLSVFTQLSQSRHRGMARWAASVAHALRIRLLSITAAVRIDNTEPVPPLATLKSAELEGLHSLLIAGAEASDDEAVVDWCTRMSRLVVADFCRRELEQAAIDAKAAVIVAEERRLAYQELAPRSAV